MPFWENIRFEIILNMIEKKQKELLTEFERTVATDEFQNSLAQNLDKFGVKKSGKTWVEVNRKEGRCQLVVDIAPEGLGDTKTVKHIINKIKPQKIFYEMSVGDDWGRSGKLIIATEDERIFLKASVYIFDESGGIWSKFNDPASDGYKDVQIGTVDFYGGGGYFEKVSS